MRDLHDKRQLLAKLRIAGSENCLMMSSPEKMVRRIFLKAGLSNVPTKIKKKCLKTHEAYMEPLKNLSCFH